MRRAIPVVILAAFSVPARSLGYTQIVAFGDSLSDTGNVYNQTFGISPQSPPYYNGRYSNGPLWLEDLATDLTLSPPTYSRGGGTDYAYGGAHTGSGSVSHFPFTFPNIGTQISSYLGSNTPNANQLFVIWGGGNDFFDNLSTSPSTPVNNIANHITALANAGAHDFLVPNLPLLGEVPDYRGSASEGTLNTLSSQFDSQLATTLANLKTSLNVNIFPLDVQSNFADILANPSKYGFTNTTQPAYNGSTVVASPDQYVFWDGKHPTRVAHQLLGDAAADLVNTHNWISTASSATWATAGNWDPAAAPASMWIAKLSNRTNSAKTAVVSASSTVHRLAVDGIASVGTMTVAIQSGATLTVSSDVQVSAAGRIDLQGGVLSSPAIQITTGTLLGDGRVSGNLASAGTVSPGHSIGSISITGSYTQQVGGTLALELGGTNATEFDRLSATGSVSLAGKLVVSTANSFVPLPGESFRVLTYGLHVGDFSTVSNQTGYAGLRFNRNFDATGLNLVASALAGDANLDAHVDLTDFTFLAANFNASGRTWLDGDFSGDGNVDLTDFTYLAANFNQTTPAAAAASPVPEPASSCLLLLGVGSILGPRRRLPVLAK